MRKVYSFILVLSLVSFATQPFIAQDDEPLTNDSIIILTQAGIEKSVIISKIRSSKTSFDLSTGALVRLKQAGVDDAVLAAMFPSQPGVSPNRKVVESRMLTVSDGTEVEVQLKNNLSGEEAKIGDIVDLTVVRDVEVDGVVVAAKGANATARITNAKKAGRWGRTGKLEWAMQELQLVDGSRIPMRFSRTLEGGSSAGSVAVATVLTTALLGPVGLLWGLKKGKAAIIPAGTKFSVYTDGDSKVSVRAQDPD